MWKKKEEEEKLWDVPLTQLGLRGMLERMWHDSNPNSTQTHDVHKIGANTALIYITQPNKSQITGLAIKVDEKLNHEWA